MNWEFLPAKDHIESVRKLWDHLNCSRGEHVLLDSDFTGALLRHFGHEQIYMRINQDPKRPAMAVVVRKRWGVWETFQPAQALTGLAIFGYQDEAGDGLLELIRSLPTYALQLAVWQQDPDFSPIQAV